MIHRFNEPGFTAGLFLLSVNDPRRHFFPWDRPLLPQLVEWLAEGWDRQGPWDLSAVLAVVPTRQAGRRLREAIVGFAAQTGRAVFAPQVCTPDGVLRGDEGLPGASPLESILAWSAVLRSIDLGNYRAVFPVDPPDRNFAWGLRLGRQLAALQATLAEAGWQFRGVASRVAADPDFPEIARWEQLADLEARYHRVLATEGRQDPQALKLAAGTAPVRPDGIERIVVLATPDPWPLAVAALSELSRDLPVTVAVFAPPDCAGDFDAWGRPNAEAWSRRSPPVEDFAAQVRLELNPEAQAERIAALAQDYRESPGALAIGVADAEVGLPLLAALGDRGLAGFDPQGRLRRSDGFYHLLAALGDLVRGAHFSVVEAVGRCPDVMAWLATRGVPGFSPARWLAGLDTLRSRHLPADLTAALSHAPELAKHYPELLPGLGALGELADELASLPFAAGAAAALGRIFAGRRAEVGRTDDAVLAEAAAVWMELVRACEAAGSAALATAEWWDLALRLFGDERRGEEKPAGAFELQGWIELLWEDAPHLVVAGLNDGLVPDAIAGDAFLPESLRLKLGLKSNVARLARDTYLLAALAESRRSHGRIDLLVGKNSAAGEPLRPSRLLLAGDEATLPARVHQLFAAPPLAGPPVPWTRAWKLTPPVVPPPLRVSVTALRSWLECPFRFYLRHVLKMEGVDPAKNEMDQLDFGTLCHAALEGIGLDPVLSACTDPRPLREYLMAEIERQVRRQFGANLSLPLVVQLESARQRLGWVAEVQAAEQAAGWRIIAVEKKVTVMIEGLEVVAKIDRIDQHQGTGEVRVLDYKTSDTAVNPAAAHLHGPAQSRQLPPWAYLDYDGKPKVWADLQLPLYRHALAAEFPTLKDCGYFNLPKASADARLFWWEPYPRELQESALACAEGVCRAIRAGEFWPPNEQLDPEWDPYGALFQRGVAASVEWKGRSS